VEHLESAIIDAAFDVQRETASGAVLDCKDCGALHIVKTNRELLKKGTKGLLYHQWLSYLPQVVHS
jgi:hypothetical protein